MSPEYEQLWEQLSPEERREKVAAHISAMQLGQRVLEEQHAQQEAIRDFEARDYQLDAFEALWTARKNGADRGLIHLATGLGKTSVAVVDYAAFRQQHIEETGETPRALFVVHQNNILEQASERFGELLPESSRAFYSNRQKTLPHNEITFATFQTLVKKPGHIPTDHFDYIIYDEAHHIEADTYKKVVEYFNPKFQLGLTATPERGDEKNITDHFGEALYTKTLPEAIAEGHLATVHYNIMQDEAVKNAIQAGFEPSSIAEIQRLFEVEPRNEEIVYEIIDAQEKIKKEQGVDIVKTIIFCADLEHADEIAGMMNGTSYHSGKSDKEQAAILNDFRNGALDTITVRDMFNEGVDIPDARLIVFLRTTESKVVFEQQLGRGLRKNANKQEVTVLDFVANIERINTIYDLINEINRLKGTYKTKDKDAPDILIHDSRIHVSGNANEFAFDQYSVDLLHHYRDILDRPHAPEDWLAVGRLAEIFNTSKPVIINAGRALGIEGEFMTGANNYFGRHYSPEEAAVITQQMNHLEKAPEGTLTTIDVANELKVDVGMVRDTAKQIGVGVIMRTNAGREGLVFTREEADAIQQHIEIHAHNEAWYLIEQLSELLAISRPTIQSIINALGIESKDMRGRRGGIRPHYPPDTIEKVRDEYNKILPAPEGWLTGNQIRLELGVNSRRMNQAIEQTGVDGRIFRSSIGKPGTHYSPEDAEAIRHEVRSNMPAPLAPEGYLSINQLSNGAYSSTVLEKMAEKGIVGTWMRGQRGKPTIFLSPEEVVKLNEK